MGSIEMPKKMEWRINMPDGTSEVFMPESGLVHRVWVALKAWIVEMVMKVQNFFENAWKMGLSEPKKAIHGLKVGMAVSLVSLFYYMRPLYEGVGGNAMWAVMTVVVVFEYTIGAALCKCINRAMGTFLAGSLGVGVHWVASQSGHTLEPIILGTSVFILASAATFSRFVPTVKAWFDYGVMIFILTFSFISVSGYRVDKLFDMAHQRLSTIAIGVSLCLIISMAVYPTWAGTELHDLIHSNMEKLADSLDGCIDEYFADDNKSDKDASKKFEGYKCVLNSKATEESMAKFAAWEPAHGNFNFRHPWKQYLQVGASVRSCAYCIETLYGCINSEIQAPEHLKKQLKNACKTLSSHTSKVLKELAETMTTMTKSSKIDYSVEGMHFGVQELQKALKSYPNQVIEPISPDTNAKADPAVKSNVSFPAIMELIPLATLVSLLVETAARVEDVVEAVNELARLAEFEPETDKKAHQNEPR